MIVLPLKLDCRSNLFPIAYPVYTSNQTSYMNTITLLIWTTVASFSTATYYHNPVLAWRPLIQVETPAACHRAALNLGLRAKEYRCIDNKSGDVR